MLVNPGWANGYVPPDIAVGKVGGARSNASGSAVYDGATCSLGTGDYL